jgi:glycosyltransferase involved in cell wall biosynthesis
MIHVGSPVDPKPGEPENQFYKRISFETGTERFFLKKDIVNADSQMQSLRNLGIQIDYGYLSARKNPISLLKAGLRIRKVAKENQVDLVHVLWGATASFITVLFSPVPVVVSYCGSDLYGNYKPDGSKAILGKISTVLSRISSYWAKAIIVKSDLLTKLLPLLVRRKVTTIPNGVNLSSFYPMSQVEAKQKLGWDIHKKYILFFNGSGAFVKNQPLALEVVEKVLRKDQNVEIFLAKNIVFEDLVWYYNAADVMLLTSFHEGSNNSIKEAMACKLPIVSVNCGDAAFRLRNAQLSKVIDSWEADKLAMEINRVLKTGKREDGPDMTFEFEMGVVAQSVEKVYNSVLRK